MADPLNPTGPPAQPPFRRGPPGGLPSAPYPSPAHREAHRRRLVQATSGGRLFAGMQRPWLTWSLVGLLVAIHLLLGLRLLLTDRVGIVGVVTAPRPDALLIRAGAMYAPRIDHGEVWRLVSCIFLHGDGVHILFNGVALAGLGRLNEAIYGRRRLLFLFVAAGLAGSTLSYLGGHRLSIGASGAVFGLMGAPIVFGWRHRDELPPGLGDRLRRALMPWVVLNLFIGVVVPFIDNLAHVGGLLGGCLLALLIGNRVVPGREGSELGRSVLAALALVLIGAAAAGVAGQWL
ncbi:MAG: rhomboid family intramembrane serine protease [Deltaproteobacteria bacterium]|nr:MAG: rhomboid family intramembrane serine protease [Deltaproteobacteria bacterium]